MGLSCDITTISYTDCILTIEDSSGNSISEFFLSSLKILVNGTDETLYLNDGVSEITINLSQLPSINGGVFVTLSDLDTFIRTQRNLCQCGCSGGGGSGITSINGDTTAIQTLSVGTSGTDFNIVDDGLGDHEFNLPTASAINRGALSTTDWSTFNGKQNALGFTPENVANKQNSLAVDGTGVKYPTVDSVNSGLSGKQNTLGFTAEDIANKSSSYTASSTTTYANTKALVDGLLTKAIGIVNCNPADTIALSSTSYWQPFSNAADGAETSRVWYSNVSGTLTRLLIRTSTTQSATGSMVITIRVELADTSITVTIAAGSAAGTFTDYVNTAPIVAGERISVKAVNNATVASSQVNQITFNII